MHRWLSTLVLLLTSLPALASPAQAVAAAYADAAKLDPKTAYQTRYLSLFHVAPDYRTEVLKVLTFHVNQLSREYTLAPPRLVTADGSLIAVELDRYGWKVSTWEKIKEHDPYYHVRIKEYWPGGVWRKVDGGDDAYYKAGNYTRFVAAPWLPAKEIAALQLLTRSESPVVDGPWWFVQSCRQLSLNNKETGLGYYDWLQIKKRADAEKLAFFDAKKSIAIGQDRRAAMDASGVATQIRGVEIHKALTGRWYITLDTDDSTGENSQLDLPGGKAKHKAEEIYYFLPNGLFGFVLCDNDGKLQASAPDFIGPDDSPLRSGRDGRIHVGLSCIRCHVEGLKPLDDYFRANFQPPIFLNVADRKTFLDTQRQYFQDLTEPLADDKATYAKVLMKVNGLKPADNAKAYARFYDWYVERRRTAADVATEIGVDARKMDAALKAYGSKGTAVPLSLAPLLREKGAVRVEVHESLIPVYYEIMRGAK